MVVKTTIEYTEEDKKLLATPLPNNPCDFCGLCSNGCCGCNKRTEYAKAVKPYKDAGVYAIARDIERLKRIEETISGFVSRYNKLNEKLPDFARRTLKIEQ